MDVMAEESFVRAQMEIYEEWLHKMQENMPFIACALIKKYFHMQPQLLEYDVTRFLYEEACNTLSEEVDLQIDISKVTLRDCAPFAVWCVELLQKYEKSKCSPFV